VSTPASVRRVTNDRSRAVLDRPQIRLGLLVLGGIALLAGLDGALLLLGVSAPLVAGRLADVHGPLMVFGFVGTVVVLERAVAARRVWGYLAPAFLGLGGITLISPLPITVGQLGFVLGSAVLLAIYGVIWNRQPSTSTAVQFLGAVLGLMATVLWMGGVSIPQVVPAMVLYLVLTIAGERLELARISPSVDARAELLLLVTALGLVAATLIGLLWPAAGYPVLGAALLALTVWLFGHDVATRLVRSRGLPRYMAACLLAGYGWLAVVGAIWLVGGAVYESVAYDALLHAVFLGFVISMIMAHAPTILPAVLRRPLPYRPVMYIPVAVLHGSLVARTLVGDAWGHAPVVQWAGVLNIVAVLLFVLVAVFSVIVGVAARPPRPTFRRPLASRVDQAPDAAPERTP
jgi:hypothetical protein